MKTSKMDKWETEKTIGNAEAPKLEKVFHCWYKIILGT